MNNLVAKKQRKSIGKLNRGKTIQLLILALPAIVAFFIFSYIPMAGVIIAFKDVNYALGIFKSPWVGFDNFKFFFTSNDAWLVIRNTLGYNLANIFIGTLFAVIFALLLNEVANRALTKFYQTVFFFPYFFSWIIVTYMVFAFFSGDPVGILVNFARHLGVDLSNFYIEPTYWPFFLVFLNIWKNLGYTTIIFYAAIMGLPADCYEAATIDGATKMQSIRYITLPLITPTISIMILLAVGKIFYSDFGLYFFIPREVGVLIPVTQTIDTYVYRMLRESSDVGMAAASGFFQSIMSFIVVIVSNAVVKKINPENSIY
jgi:ABC-type polysaccharide transport system, permease component